MNNVSKSIGWANFTINPVKGLCPVDCKDNQGRPYCYARSLYNRFHWNPEIRWNPQPLTDVLNLEKASRIFVGSTIELFGDWIDPGWLKCIFGAVKAKPQHTFVFLTKCPWNLAKWNPWPENAWVGASATNKSQFQDAVGHLPTVQVKVHFISFEPLLERMNINRPYGLEGIQWIILGGKSGKGKFYPPEEWIQEIEVEADKLGIPCFEKQNLRKAWDKPPRRELPV